MTIDEAIPRLMDMYNYYNDTDIDAYEAFDKEDNNALEIALDAMRKYQKIENIVDAYVTDNPREPMYDTEDYMESIKEVIADGSN